MSTNNLKERKSVMKYSVFTASTPEYNVDDTVSLLTQLGYNGVERRVPNPAPEIIPQPYDYSSRYWSFNKSTLSLDNILEIAPASSKNAKHPISKYSPLPLIF